MRRTPVLMLVGALVAGACTANPVTMPHGSEAPSSATSMTTTTAPQSPPTTGAPTSPTKRQSPAVDACAASNMASLEVASRCLVDAVAAGKRAAAARFATPEAVEWAFGQKSAFGGLRFHSCDPPKRDEEQCYFTGGGRLFTFTGGNWSAGEDGNPSGYLVTDAISTRGTPPS